MLWVFFLLCFIVQMFKCTRNFLNSFNSCLYSTTLSGSNCTLHLPSQHQGKLHDILALYHHPLSLFAVRHVFCHSSPVSNSNRHWAAFCYRSRFVGWKEREKWSPSGFEHSIEEPKREHRWEKRWKEGLSAEAVAFIEEKVRYGLDREAICFLLLCDSDLPDMNPAVRQKLSFTKGLKLL